ncbi:tape measure protein [Ligilactobacillus sp. LYQ139]|uniref:tape measure protein n=1 Tax=Ligilactobacillus sp. LYQ139 TaxID=3378800 RepID=UPI003854A2B3
MAVVEQQFVWKFIDQVTNGVNRAKQAIMEAQEAVKGSGTEIAAQGAHWAEYSAKATNAMDKVQHDAVSLKTDVESAINGTDDKVKNAGSSWSSFSTKAKEAIDKVVNTAKNMKDGVMNSLSSAEKNVDRFGSAINKLPREKTTEIKAKIEDGNLGKFSREVRDVPKRKVTEIKAETNQSVLSRIINSFKKIPSHKTVDIEAKDHASGVLSRISAGASETGHRFSALKDIMLGTFVGGAIAAGIGAIGSKLSELWHESDEVAKENQVMTQTWNTLTGSAGQANAMVDSIQHLATATGQSTSLVNELEQSFYHLNSNKTQADNLTKSMLNMGDAVGLSVEQLKAVSQDMTHAMATGKVTAGELNQIGGYFPMIDEAMAHACHTSVAGMRQMARQGKISASTLEQVFNELGQDKYGKAAENMMKTMWGMERVIKSRSKQLISDFQMPFLNAKSPVFEAVSKWVSSKDTDAEFQKLGKTVAKGMQVVSKAFTGSGDVKTIQHEMDNAINSITKGVAVASQFIAKHATTIKAAFSAMGSAVKIAFEVIGTAVGTVIKVLSSVLGIFDKTSKSGKDSANAMQTVANALKALSNNRQAIKLLADALIGLFAAKKAMGFISMVNNAHEALFKFGNTKLGSLTSSIAKLGGKGIKSAISSVGTLAKKIGSLSAAGIKGAVNGLGRLAKGAASLAGSAVKGAIATIRTLTTATTSLSVSMFGVDVPIVLIVGALALLGLGIYEAYKHCKPFRDAVNAIGSVLVKLVSACGRLVKDGINVLIKSFTNIGKTAKSIWNAVPDAFKRAYGTILKGDIDFIKSYVKAWQDWSKGLLELLQGHWGKAGQYFSKAYKTFFKGLTNWVKSSQKAWGQWAKALLQLITKHWGSIGKLFSKGWKDLQKLFKDGSKILLKGWQALTKSIQDLWSKSWNKVSSITAKVWKDITTKVAKGAEQVRNSVSQGINKIKVEWNKDWSVISSTTVHIWNGIKDRVSEGMNNVRSNVSNKMAQVKADWSSAWSAVRAVASRIWGAIKADIGSAISSIASHISSTLNSISSVWSSAWNGMKSAFQSIWNGIKSAAQDGMNGVINVINGAIGGINKVWSFFTGKGTGLGEIGHVHFAKGGIVGERKGALSVINDGAGPHWKELVRTPSGEYFMSNQRNWTGLLPVGSRVYSGEETHAIMQMAGVEHYATGGIVGMQAQHFDGGGWVQEGIDWAKGAWNNVKDWLGDKLDALDDFLDDPIKALKGIIQKAANALLGLVPSQYRGIGKWVVDKLPSAMKDWAVRILKPIEEKLSEEEGGSGNWREVIHHAEHLMHVHLSENQVSRLLRQIQTESGGNPHIRQQITDINSIEGHPAQGLLQFIPSTFNAWAMPGHHNIMSGLDQIMAAINCLNHGGEGGWGNIGNGHGWWTGGEVWGKQLGWVGDNTEGHEYVINPYAPSAKPLLEKAVNETMLAQPEPSQAPVHADSADGDKLDEIVELLKMLVAKDMTISLEDIAQRLRKQDAHVLRMQTKQGVF